jgi:DNA repair exonuclease SbcCD ATPase subunit
MELQTNKNLETLTTEILIYKEQVGAGIIEIGKRLIQAKELVGHGNWENYLKEKVDFSQMSANRFMRIAKEFSNLTPMLDLGIKKLYALLDVPSEERETFIESKHVVNDTEKSVNEMTTRELQRVISEKKQLENELINKINIISDLQAKPPQIKTIYKDNPELEASLQNKQRELQQKTQQLNELQTKLSSLQSLQNKQSEIETTYRQIDELKKKMSVYRTEIEDTTKLLLFFDEMDKFISSQMFPVVSQYSISKLSEQTKIKANNIIENLNNWIFAFENKFKIKGN